MITAQSLAKHRKKLIFGFLAGLVALGALATLFSVYFDKYKWTFQTPLKIEQRKEAVKPVVSVAYAKEPDPTPEPLKGDQGSTIEQLMDGIWFNESTRGKNQTGLAEYCTSKGQWNEIGMGGMKLKKCYKDAKEGFADLRNWLTQRLPNFNNNEAVLLCYYNTGNILLKGQTCKYYTDYKSNRKEQYELTNNF